MRFLRKILLYLLVVFAAAYLLDSAVYLLRGKPTGTVQVTRLLAIPLKGGKTEYDPAGTSQVKLHALHLSARQRRPLLVSAQQPE